MLKGTAYKNCVRPIILHGIELLCVSEDYIDNFWDWQIYCESNCVEHSILIGKKTTDIMQMLDWNEVPELIAITDSIVDVDMCCGESGITGYPVCWLSRFTIWVT